MPKVFNQLSLEVEEYIREYIAVNHLQPGDKLPAERAFSTELGITRGTLRHGLELLISDGIIENRKNSGYYICPPKITRELLYYCFPYKDRHLIQSGYRVTPINAIPDRIQNIVNNILGPIKMEKSNTRRHLEYVNDTPISITYTFQEPVSQALIPYLFEMDTIPEALTVTQSIRVIDADYAEPEIIGLLKLNPPDTLLLISNFVHYRNQIIGICLSICVGTRINLVTEIDLKNASDGA